MTFRQRRRLRDTIVIGILLCFPIATLIQQFRLRWNWVRDFPQTDQLARFSQESKAFEPFLEHQPTTAFFSDLPTNDGRRITDRVWLQFTLIPHLLDDSAPSAYLVARLYNLPNDSTLLAQQHLHIVQSYPDGLALLKRES